MKVILSLMVILAVLAGCVLCLALNSDVMASLFDAHALPQAQGDYQALAGEITAYLDGTQGALPSFQPHEEAHMVDVRQIFNCLKALMGLGFTAGFFLWFWRAEKAFIKTCLGFIGVAGGLALWAFIDFDSLFLAFHRLVFTNELWLLNPQTDLMIQLMPTSFFTSYATLIALVFGIILVVMMGIAFFTQRRQARDVS